MGIHLLYAGSVTKVVRLLWHPILLSYDHNYRSSEHDQIIAYHNSRWCIIAKVQVDIWHQVIELMLILKAQGSIITSISHECLGPGFQTFHKCMDPVFHNVWAQGSKHSTNVWAQCSKVPLNVWAQGSKHSGSSVPKFP